MSYKFLTVEMAKYLDTLVDHPMDIMRIEFMDEFKLEEADAIRFIADWTRYGVCPVCNGTTKVPLTEEEATYSWNKDRTEKDCKNCGGQYQFGKPCGLVRLNKKGKPCKHSYVNLSSTSRGLHKYQCVECYDSYQIDSSG